MHSPTRSKTINKAIERNPKIDASESFSDSDGYWLVLRPGFECSMSGCHTIHEWNVRDVLTAIANIQPCDCDQCKGAKQ